MNGYNFTDRVRKVLQMAREEAARLHHEYVGTEHILLGLIREGEGVAAAVLTNLPMRAAVDEAVRRVREGGALAPALGAAKLFPPLVIHLIASGEATGRLDTMLARAAEAQARELENWIRGLTALLEPMLILAMGAIVLFVVVAILLPIFEMNQLVR